MALQTFCDMDISVSKEHIEGILARGKIEYYLVKFEYKDYPHSVAIHKQVDKAGKVFYRVSHIDDNFLRFICLAEPFNSAEEAVEYIAKQPNVNRFL